MKCSLSPGTKWIMSHSASSLQWVTLALQVKTQVQERGPQDPPHSSPCPHLITLNSYTPATKAFSWLLQRVQCIRTSESYVCSCFYPGDPPRTLHVAALLCRSPHQRGLEGEPWYSLPPPLLGSFMYIIRLWFYTSIYLPVYLFIICPPHYNLSFSKARIISCLFTTLSPDFSTNLGYHEQFSGWMNGDQWLHLSRSSPITEGVTSTQAWPPTWMSGFANSIHATLRKLKSTWFSI